MRVVLLAALSAAAAHLLVPGSGMSGGRLLLLLPEVSFEGEGLTVSPVFGC